MKIMSMMAAAGLALAGLVGGGSGNAGASEMTAGNIWYAQASSLKGLYTTNASPPNEWMVRPINLQTVLQILHSENGSFFGRVTQIGVRAGQPDFLRCLRVIGSVSSGSVQFNFTGSEAAAVEGGLGKFTVQGARDRLEFQYSASFRASGLAQRGVMTECRPGDACNASVPGGRGRTMAQVLRLCDGR